MSTARALRGAAALFVWTLSFALPAGAYTIVFKDGSSIVTLDRYTIEGDFAHATLPSGTRTTFPAAEIDVETTDQINRLGIQRGVVLKGSDPWTEPETDTVRRDTVADLARSGYTDLSLPDRSQTRQIRRTPAGNPDLFTLERRPSADEEATAALEEAFARTAGAPKVFAGTQEGRFLIELTTDQENEVFEALQASAKALLEVRRDLPRIAALELLMATGERIRAAQFLLGPEAARQLVDGAVEPAEFFLLNVQF